MTLHDLSFQSDLTNVGFKERYFWCAPAPMNAKCPLHNNGHSKPLFDCVKLHKLYILESIHFHLEVPLLKHWLLIVAEDKIRTLFVSLSADKPEKIALKTTFPVHCSGARVANLGFNCTGPCMSKLSLTVIQWLQAFTQKLMRIFRHLKVDKILKIIANFQDSSLDIVHSDT